MKELEQMRRDYVQPALMENLMDENPIVQFQNWFDKANEVYGMETNAMFLATVNAAGQPSCRTVLLKGVSKNGFRFYTNYDSKKGREIIAQPQIALLFYWPVLDRQIRIEGKALKLEPQQSDDYFYSRPRGSQISAIVSPQSKVISGYDELITAWDQQNKLDSLKRPHQWGGFEVKPEYFEFWQGRSNRLHDRLSYQWNEVDQKYTVERLAP